MLRRGRETDLELSKHPEGQRHDGKISTNVDNTGVDEFSGSGGGGAIAVL